jgi:hypothetical protein
LTVVVSRGVRLGAGQTTADEHAAIARDASFSAVTMSHVNAPPQHLHNKI